MKIKRGIIALIVCCSFWINVGSAYGQETILAFRDIGGSYAEDSIIRLTKQGIFNGLNAQQFAPGRNITRLQFSVVIAKALGVQPFFPSVPTFSDLLPGTLDSGYVEALAKLELIRGMGSKTFNGGSPIRRQDAAVMIERATGTDEEVFSIVGKYSDKNDISPYAVNSVAYVTTKGWMKGNGGHFYPQHFLTRGEAAILMDRLFQDRMVQAGKALQKPVESLEAGLGTAIEIETRVSQDPVTFSTVYGNDNPALFSISPEGIIITGNEPGKGTITLNAGSSFFPVNVDVYRPKIEDYYVPNPVYMPSQVLDTELSVSCRVTAHSPDAAFRNTEYKEHSGPVEGLSSKGSNWTGFLRQQGRDVVVDLHKLNTISGLSLEFEQDANAGVYAPKYINGFVSPDGVSWYQLGQVYHRVDPSDKKAQNVTLSLIFPSVAARYVKISFPVDIWVFARHLKVYGGSPAEKPVILAPMVGNNDPEGSYMRDDEIKDLLLVYTGDKSAKQTLGRDDFMPLVAYLNRQGQIKGKMFDTMLFLPYNGLPCTKEGWSSYLTDLFERGKQLDALNESVARINQLTGGKHKEKVILTIPYPDSKQSDFGIMEQKLITLSFLEQSGGTQQAGKNRLEAVQWFYKRMMTMWANAKFENLELAGIYWYGESVNKTIASEAGLVQAVGDMVRGNKQNYFWIPSYSAPGFKEWKTYGFTHVWLQPNYYANQEQPEDRMSLAAELAKQYRTGIEIEMDSRILTTRYYYDLFYKELNKAHEKDLGRDSSNAYYIGLKNTLLDTVNSDIPEIRKIYDDIYRWINDSYN